MIDLRIASSDLAALRSTVLGHKDERCAVLLTSRLEQGRRALLVREIVLPEDADYARRSPIHAELRPDFVARVTKRAKLASLSLVFVHTHPGDQSPRFSRTDDEGERELAAFLARRGLEEPHAALVLSDGGMCARLLGRPDMIRVVSVGDRLTVEFDAHREETTAAPMFDRQVRAFGIEGQKVLQELRVGIVGLGGTGSIAAQQLAHLGVRDFVLIDPDHLELTNLNRVVGASESDVDLPKSELARRHVQAIAPTARVRSVVGDVVHAAVAKELLSADIILCCTDSHGSRSVIQQVAYQYLIPCVDVGSTITTHDGQVTGVYGRVQLLGPDQACLWCSGLLSSEEVRRDMMSAFERKADPYIQGAHEPAPSVISLNGTVVSLAVTMLLGIVTAVPVGPRHLIYNASASTLRPARATPQDGCFICSRQGVFGRGDLQPLFARQD
ncbi:MAG: ThiF family adenylyltransferase [Alphaproteobacteria bacterium]|nr:ThiF family adenylyltransferase [Alphaproteobacteria bacterium]